MSPTSGPTAPTPTTSGPTAPWPTSASSASEAPTGDHRQRGERLPDGQRRDRVRPGRQADRAPYGRRALDGERLFGGEGRADALHHRRPRAVWRPPARQGGREPVSRRPIATLELAGCIEYGPA